MNILIIILGLVALLFIFIGYRYDKKRGNPFEERIYNYRKNIVSIAIFSCALLCLLSGTVLISWAFGNYESNDIVETYMNNKEIINQTTIKNNKKKYLKEKINVNFDYLKAVNTDTVAWLVVDGTNINYPIVQTKDNEYYLKHSFTNEKNKSGWLYVDYRNKVDNSDKNLIIYGHNRINKTMFGTLGNTLDEEWFNNSEDHLIKLVTENATYVYNIFSSYVVPVETYYLKTEFDKTNFELFIKAMLVRSNFNYNVPFNEINNIITLSTCTGNNDKRIVVHASLVEIN